MGKLKNVQERIIEVTQQINDNYRKAYARFPNKVLADMSAEGGQTKLLRNELEVLENKRVHLLDRREGWLQKALWSIFTPIIVTVITTYILFRLNLK